MQDLHRIIRTVLVGAVMSVTLASASAWADLTAEQANALRMNIVTGDKAALETLITEAQQGNRYAQIGLGDFYYRTIGARQDYSQAAQWYRKAAEQGDAYGQFLLGMLYGFGRGVPQDYSQERQWTLKAAEQGYADAQVAMGDFYWGGHGVRQDLSQVVQWYRKAAEQGNAYAQSLLSDLYEDGVGVPQNKVVAYALLNLLAAQEFSSGDRYASDRRSKLANRMTEQQIEAGQALTGKMSVQGHLLQALDQYLAASADNKR
ncbi:MAG: sel1 repeat family protein [Desulfovibrionaceae bacterium]|jgi:TPR repeat protein|nr:sel1 repeat family protein [Desulfovibrionaceae bacterium]